MEDLQYSHIREHTNDDQHNLHVVGAEMWLYGQAHLKILSQASMYSRLGAMAGPHTQYYSVPLRGQRECWLHKHDEALDSLERIAGWVTGI
ncbi:hypothetical protein HYH03_018406 [Edaphochlamys debaryana]|uniref:Uncharacterized protein n=1 Tax=Edaphochlamys debaryana TaxID=47281 RepID=A0A835XFY6_9CHLO|nr:hypothetical protein HYH03_018406 [Edaphochlamys debaryana]|eukprot:KAG2482669.1 hypothetical protein HYH03_018406 [Edaphochlamys debaryana]